MRERVSAIVESIRTDFYTYSLYIYTIDSVKVQCKLIRSNRLVKSMDLPMPTPFSHWDPLLQRRIVRKSPTKYARSLTPASSTAATPIMGRLSMNTPEMPADRSMPPPPPAASVSRPPEVSAPISPAKSMKTPSKPAELEAESIALAYKLQQEEHAAFLHAVQANSPAPRSATAVEDTVAGQRAPAHAESMLPDAHQMMELDGGEDEESLQLALQLQQEELHWQSLQSRRAVAAAIGSQPDEEMDEDLRLAQMLQAQEDGHP